MIRPIDRSGWLNWNPFDELDFFLQSAARPTRQGPPVTILGNEGEIRLEAEVPGVDRESITISVEDCVLTLDISPPEKHEDEQAHIAERNRQPRKRLFTLPYEIESSEVRARCSDGVLQVVLPRKATSRPKQISINE